MRVMTFNIRYGTAPDGPHAWPHRRDLCAEAIGDARCDLVALQEVLPFQLEEILHAVPALVAVNARRYAGPRRSAMCVLLADPRRLEAGRGGAFWLSESPDVPGSRGWDAVVPRVCVWSVFLDRERGRRFAAFATHLDQRGAEAREQGAALIARRMEQLTAPPRLLLGDLNAREGSAPQRVLNDAGLRDTYRDAHPDAEEIHTFHGFKASRRLGKIDVIMADAGWRTLDAGVLADDREGRWPSDHHPVTATLEPLP